MGNLSNLYISKSYQSLIHLETDNTASSTLVGLQDGLGNSIGISVNTSGSLSISGSFTASLANGYAWVGDGNNKTSLVPTSSFGSVTSAITGSSLITASFSGNTLTFTKGDSSQFGVVIPDVSGSGPTDISALNAFTASQYTINSAIGASTSSLNAFTSSQDTKNSTLATYTGSVDTKFTTIGTQSGSWDNTALNSFTQSQDTKNSTLSSVTASLNTSASLAVYTASFSGNTLTFTKGNSSTFSVVLPDVSGSDISSLNSFTQSQETKNSTLATYTASVDTKFSTIGTQSGSWDNTALNSFTQSVDSKFVAVGSSTASLNAFTASQEILNTTFATTGSNTFTGYNTFNQQVDIKNGQAILMYGNDNNPSTAFGVRTTSGSFEIVKLGLASKVDLQNTSLLVSGTFTSSLQQGYAWVGGVGDVSKLVPTSSFISTPTDISALNSFTQSQDTKNSTLSTYTASVDQKFSNIGSQSGSWDNTNLNSFTQSVDTKFTAVGSSTASLNSFTSSQETKNSTLATYTGSNDTKWSNLGSQSGSFVTESETGSFARTNVDNNFSANQTFTNISAVSASFTYLQTLYETSSVIYSSGSNQFGDELSDIQTLSGSVKIQGNLTINGTPVETSSVDISALNAFTQSQETKNSTLGSYTASVDTKFVAVGSSTASLNSYTSSQDTKNSTLGIYTASVDTKFSTIGTQSGSWDNTALNQFTQSQDTKNSTLATYTGSNDTKWNTLGGQTGSYVTSGITGSSLITASVSLNTITFTKGDASTFNVTVNTGSAVTTDISSLNSFTQSQETKNSTLATYTASVDTKFSTIGTQSGSWDNTSLNSFTQSVDTKFVAVGSSTSSLNAYTQSNDTKWSNLASQSGSWVTSAITGSSLITASFSGNTLTFTKGDTTTFGIVIPDASGSVIPAGTISGSTQIIELGFQTTASFNAYTQSNDSKVNNLINATGSYAISSSVAAVDAAQQLQINSLIAATGSYITASVDITSLNQFTQSQESKNTTLASVTSSLNSATASLFTSASLGLTTASFSGNTLTFTKGDSTTFGIVIPDASGSVIPAGTISGSSQVDYPFISNIPAGIISSSQQLPSGLVSGSSQLTASYDLRYELSGALQPLPSGLVSGSTQIVELGFQTTASFNSYTQSNDTKWNTLGGQTGSYVTSAITGSSLVTASFSGNTLTFTKGDSSTFGVVIPDVSGSDLSALNAFTQSQETKNSTLGTYTASVDTQFVAVGSSTSSLNSATASLFTSASLALVTASLSGNTITFTKGDTTTFGFTIPDVSGSTIPTGTISGSSQITALGFVSSSVTGSSLVTGSVAGNILTFTKGDATQFSLTVATGSGGGGSTDTGSLMVTGSVNVNVLTFTKGDGSTFDLTVAASGSSPAGTVSSSQQIIDYNIFATTGSNYFVGVNNFSGSAGNANIVNLIGSSKITLGGTTMPFNETAFVSMVAGDGTNQGGALQFQVSNGGSTFLCNDAPSGSTQSVGNTPIVFENNTRSGSITVRNSGNTGNITLQNYTGSINLQAGSSISISGSSTTIQDVNFIPFSASLNSRILAVTGSSINTGSLMTTGSVSGNVLTFTKGDASTFTLTVATGSGGGGSIDTGSFATTGSNTFRGNQTIETSSYLTVGSNEEYIRTSFNTLTLKNKTGVFVNYEAPETYFQSNGNFNFQNSIGGNGSGSMAFLIQNGGSYSTQVQGAGTIGFTANTGSISLTTPDILNLQSNVLKLKSADASFTTQIINASGSLMLATAASSTASAHIAQSSPANQVNLIFKPNSNTGATIISGSSNIFTNPATPTTGYKRYIGGSNNLYLNSSNGITSQLTQSATTVSGATPTMNNNIFAGTGNFSINQATNGGTHTYNNNIIGGTGNTTINALGFTGSLNLSSNFNNNGTITVNAASASVTEITSGLSGSGTINVNNNGNFGGTMTITSPRTLLTTSTQNVLYNVLAGGAITVTNISSSAVVSATGNIGASSFTYSNAGAAGLGLHTTAGSMSSNFGAMSLIASASAINASNNISPTSMTVTNRMWSGSLGAGALTFATNQIQGGGNTYTISGSFGGTSNPTMVANGIFGLSNTLFTNVEGRGNYVDVRSNLVGGTFLILTGSNNNAITGSGGGYFGRFNANDGRRNGTGENILVVGTGTSEATRKTGFLIDSGSNTFVEGTLNVSGSSSFTGSITIQSGSGDLFVYGNKQFNVGAFQSNVTQSGSAAVSQSMNFETTDISNGVSMVSNSRITLANSGTYNIQFSAQLLADTGADTVWIWLKKNGTNVSSTTTKLLLRNNEAAVAAWNFVVEAAASDYFELVWESANGDTVLLTEAAGGNYPAIPSIILTVTQVR